MTVQGAAMRYYRRAIWERDGGICALCGQPVELDAMDLDHIVQQSEGGSDEFENLRPTHSPCNRGRERVMRPHVVGRQTYFVINEAARRFRVPRDQMWEWVRLRRLHTYRKTGYGPRMIETTELQTLLWHEEFARGDKSLKALE